MPEDLIIRWTARVAVSCYVMRLMIDAGAARSVPAQKWARAWWTLGCAVFVAHVLTAFHFQHGWNHTVAFDYTAKRTAELTGWNSGIGLYINEAFLVLWLADTIQWWRDFNWSQNRLAYWIVQGIFGFLIFQSTAVFGPPFWKVVVTAVILALTVLRLRAHAASNGRKPELNI